MGAAMVNGSVGTLSVSGKRVFKRLVIPFILGTLIFIGVVATLSASGSTASASAATYTYLVPGQYPTIQSAVDAAYGTGETILVSDGVYSERIDFKKKQNLTVKSVNGPGSTTIQGDGRDGYVVSFTHGEPSTAVLQGFTIDNQYFYDHTGGIDIENGAQPTLKNLYVRGNSLRNSGADHFGGGIRIHEGGATISDCIIGGAGGGNGGDMGGGGIYAASTAKYALNITNSEISYNYSITMGGGLYADDYAGDITIDDSMITNNTIGSGYGAGIANRASVHMYMTDTDVDYNVNNAAYSTNHGGGIAVIGGGSVKFTNGSISGNSAYRSGGAVDVKDSGSVFTCDKCVMAGNRSGGDSSGGAMILTGGTANLTNCMITGNITGTNYWSAGGGILNAGGTLNIQQSTIAGNWARKWGGAIYTSSGKTTCDGCLLWGNDANDANTDDIKGESGTTTINYSAIKSGTGYSGSHNISSIAGSVFVSFDPASNGNPKTGGDYHIRPDATQAIDSANAASQVYDDIDGQTRTGVNDMGADELGSICTGGKPDLNLSLDSVQWASYADYIAHYLTVNYNVNNVGSSTANNMQYVGSTATASVVCMTAGPISLGTVNGGSSATLTLVYSLPPCGSVSHFQATVYVTAKDACGTSYYYPGPYQG